MQNQFPNVDQHNISVGGFGIAANLVVSLCQHLKAEPNIVPKFQLLVMPILNLNAPEMYESWAEYKDLLIEDAESFAYQIGKSVPEKSDRISPLMSPILISDDNLMDLPATFIAVAEVDLVRSQGQTFAARLEEKDVPVQIEMQVLF